MNRACAPEGVSLKLSTITPGSYLLVFTIGTFGGLDNKTVCVIVYCCLLLDCILLFAVELYIVCCWIIHIVCGYRLSLIKSYIFLDNYYILSY